MDRHEYNSVDTREGTCDVKFVVKHDDDCYIPGYWYTYHADGVFITVHFRYSAGVIVTIIISTEDDNKLACHTPTSRQPCLSPDHRDPLTQPVSLARVPFIISVRPFPSHKHTSA